MTALAFVLGVTGLAWGVIADRIAARWPDHEPPITTPRPVDWRTFVVAVVAGGGMAAVAIRFEEPVRVGLFVAWVAVLALLLATDLDQRLLPDVLTLPLVPAAALAGLLGANPLVADGMVLPVAAAIAFPAGLLLLSLPFGEGAIGIGDLKLLISVGLTLGLVRTFAAVTVGAMLSGVVVIALLAVRRIGRRSYIPYGPFLIVGTLWAALVAP